MEVNGKEIDEKDEIKEAFTNHYRDIFYNTYTSDIRLNWDQLFSGECLNLSTLDNPFMEDEIKIVVFGLASKKALEPDGFPLSFYQRYWTALKSDISRLFKDIYSEKVDLSRSNYTFMTLIPKKSESLSYG